MIEIGGKPILWHIMKEYSYYGFNEFIICLGYKAHKIKEYGFDVDIIYDWDGDLLGNKDAPIDKGRQVYSKLYRERKNISEFPDQKDNKEEPVNEIPVED